MDHRRLSLSDEVASRLQEMIRGGQLRAGDRLPPERELARVLGVSRPTLRTGIRSLIATGVLVARRGAGAFVAAGQPSFYGGLVLPVALPSDLQTDGELFEACRALAPCAAAFAARRATGEQMAAMAEEIAGMYASLDHPERYLAHEIRFYRAVASACGNRVLEVLLHVLATSRHEVLIRAAGRASSLKRAADEHREIYHAIRGRNADAAREAMLYYLDFAQKEFRDKGGV